MTRSSGLSMVRLELARDPQFPEGSARHGYEFVAPLGADGHIDAARWKAARQRCSVRRFWGDAAEEQGHLIHLGGRQGGGWAFHYDIEGDPDLDEPGYRFAAHAFRPGEYVSIREQDGRLRTFRVAAVHLHA